MQTLFEQNSTLLFIALLWMLPWKGFALWQAARNNHRRWFILLLVINTMAILEIIYLFILNKKGDLFVRTEGVNGEGIW